MKKEFTYVNPDGKWSSNNLELPVPYSVYQPHVAIQGWSRIPPVTDKRWNKDVVRDPLSDGSFCTLTHEQKSPITLKIWPNQNSFQIMKFQQNKIQHTLDIKVWDVMFYILDTNWEYTFGLHFWDVLKLTHKKDLRYSCNEREILQMLQDGPNTGEVGDDVQQANHHLEDRLWGLLWSQSPRWRNLRLKSTRKGGGGDVRIKTTCKYGYLAPPSTSACKTLGSLGL